MTPVTISHKGSFKNIKRFCKTMRSAEIRGSLETYAKLGVSLLQQSTPRDSGVTASSWDYEIEITRTKWSVQWTNNEKTYQGDPIVILLQFGHGTGTGGYVQGRDFINPAMRPVFDQLADDVWKAVQNA